MILVPDSEMLPIYSILKMFNGSVYSITSIAAYGGISFNSIYDVTYSPVSKNYYVTDYGTSTLVALDANFTFVKSAFVQDCFGIENFNNSVYVTAYTSSRIYRFDLNLTWLNSYFSNITSYYYGITYNSKLKLIQACDYNYNILNAFDFSLNRLYSDSYYVSSCLAVAVLDSNIVYVGRASTYIQVYVNKFFLTNYQVCTTGAVYDLIMDSTSGVNYLLIACYSDKKVNLYTASGTQITNTNSYRFSQCESF